jgi:hypothetical protein
MAASQRFVNSAKIINHIIKLNLLLLFFFPQMLSLKVATPLPRKRENPRLAHSSATANQL